MPKITLARQQDRYDAILAAARFVLAADGFDDVSIAAVARRAGVSDGTIYRYFTDKRDLFGVVLEDFYGGVIADLEAADLKTAGFRQRIRAMVETHIRVFAANPDLCRMFLTEVRLKNNDRSARILDLNRRYTSVLLRAAADGIAEGVVPPDADPRLLRDLLFGGIEHFAWRHIELLDRVDIGSAAARIADILLDGFCRAPA